MQNIQRLIVASLAAFAMSSCGKAGNNPAKADAQPTAESGVDPKEVQALTTEAEADINALAATIQETMSGLAQSGQATPAQLAIVVDGETLPIDWWLWNQGFLELKGVAGGDPIFGLTSRGLAAAQQTGPWFALVPSAPTGSCSVGESLAHPTCSLSVRYQVTKTTSGKVVLPKAEFPGLTVSDAANLVDGGWQVAPFAQAGAPHKIILDAMLGPIETRAAARQVYAQAVVEQARNLQTSTADGPSQDD